MTCGNCGCQDSLTWRMKGKSSKDCDWVAKKPDKYCKKKDEDGTKAKDAWWVLGVILSVSDTPRSSLTALAAHRPPHPASWPARLAIETSGRGWDVTAHISLSSIDGELAGSLIL